MPLDATDMELLPLIMDLIEDVNTGKILPKDLINDSNFIKQRIKNFKATIANEMESFIDTIDRDSLESDINKKEQVLQRFKEQVELRFNKSK